MANSSEPALRPYAVQMHIHASASEGKASMLAHDHMAAQAGTVDAIWWTEHDWRLANFAKVQRFSFDQSEERVAFPARQPSNGLPPLEVAMTWQPDAATDAAAQCTADWSDEHSYDGASSLRVSASPNGQQPMTSRCAFVVDNHHDACPLYSRPHVKIAVRPPQGMNEGDEVFIEFVLSEQPPDLKQAQLRYVIGSGLNERAVDGSTLTIPLEAKIGQWNVVELDLAADVAGLGLPAEGLDNAMHQIRVGVTARRAETTAHFDGLEVSASLRGDVLLEVQRELARRLPMRVKHLVGMEVSWYGHHMNGFGRHVPIPDYETADPVTLTTRGIVEHIHRHDGLACYNHPPTGDVEAHAARLIENEAYGADLMEVAHAKSIGQGLDARLRLWDLLSQAGVVLTGLGVGDAHHASTGWEPHGPHPCFWVTHIWADELQEEALMKGLAAGRVYFADPSRFRGSLDIEGPGDLHMGAAMVNTEPCSLKASVTGAKSGDTIRWICNGEPVQTDPLASGSGQSRFTLTPGTAGVQAVRIELHRHEEGSDQPIRIACSNPVFLVPSEEALSRRGSARLVTRPVANS